MTNDEIRAALTARIAAMDPAVTDACERYLEAEQAYRLLEREQQALKDALWALRDRSDEGGMVVPPEFRRHATTVEKQFGIVLGEARSSFSIPFGGEPLTDVKGARP